MEFPSSFDDGNFTMFESFTKGKKDAPLNRYKGSDC